MFGQPSKGQAGENAGLTRRALLAGAGATVSSAALAIAIVPAVTADEVSALPVENITDKIERLSRELSAVMGEYQNGDWKITVGAGDNVSLQPSLMGAPAYRAEIHLTNYRRTMVEADPTITGWEASYSVDTGKLSSIMPRYQS